MRMLLLFILLAIQLPTIAKAANCGGYNYPQLDSAGCVAEPGCMVEGNACASCAEDRYCPQDAVNVCESTNGACDCPSNFPKSTVGTANIGDCYTPCAATSDNYDSYTKDCGLTYLGHSNANEVSCKQNGIITYNQNDANYHAEPLSDGTYGCYFKSRSCSAFITNTCSGNIFGPAIWQQSYEWDVSACECKQEEFIDTENFCNGKRNKKPSAPTISGVNEPINYNYDTQSSWHWCVSCLPGYYVESDDILEAGGNNQTCIVGEDNNGGPYAVCKCTPAPQGTWITSCNISYPITNPDILPCSTTNCAAGKTTTGTGSTNSNACHYGPETQICDNTGNCKNLSDFDDPESWTDL